MELQPLSVLNVAMQSDYREVVVREVLEQYQQASPSARRSLEKALRTHVKVKGFRDPVQAPVTTLLRDVVKTSCYSDIVLRAVLRVWLELHKDLWETMYDFLTTQGTSIAEPTDLPRVIEAFRSRYTDFDEDDIALMLHCIKVFEEPLPTSEESTQREESAVKWQQWLEELQALPADSPEWKPETITAFVEAIWQLAESKLQEREAPREQLRLTLASLVHQPEDIINYFGMSDVSTWTADTCEISETVALEKQVAGLNEALLRYQHLRQQPDAIELRENRRRRDELTALEDTILETYGRLSIVFGSPPPDVPPTEPEESSRGEQEYQKETEPLDSSIASEPQAVETEEVGSESEQVLQALSEEEPYETRSSIPEAERIMEPPPKDERDLTSEKNFLSEEKTTAPLEEPVVEHEPASGFSSGLRPSQEIATALQSDDRDELWHALVWALIAEDDLPGAYWLTRSLNASRRLAPMPDYLLKAAQGARWLTPDDEEGFVSDLLDIAKTTQPASDDVQTLIGLAASLRPALIAPGSGMISWVKVPSCCPELHDLVTAVREFAKLNIALRPEALDSVTGVEQHEATLSKIVHDAQQWLQEAPNQQTTLRRASKVWYHLVGPRGELRELLLPVSEDRRSEADAVRGRLDQWEQENYISDRIHQIDRRLAGKKPRPIDGKIYQWVVRNVRDTCLLARRWCEWVGHSRDIGARGNWRFSQVEQLRSSIQETLAEVEAALDRFSQLAQPASLAAATCCLKRAIKQLDETLNLKTVETALPMRTWEWFTSGAENLSIALSRRLLWFPELSLGDNGQPSEEIHIARFLCIAYNQERSLRTAFESWLNKQDYRFVKTLLVGMRDETDETKITEMSSHYQEVLDGSRLALSEHVHRTDQEIEQAVVDGIIGEERSGYNADVVAVSSKEVLNFAPEFEKLDSVHERLADARKKRLEELRKTWDGVEKRLERSRIDSAKKKDIKDRISRELEGEDTRVVEERIALLEEVLDIGGDLEEIFSKSSGPMRDVLAEFKQRAPKIEEWFEQAQGLPKIIKDIERAPRNPLGGINFDGVPKPRRDEAVRAIAAWRRLKQHDPKNLGRDQLATLLGYLGFEKTEFQVRGRGVDWLHASAEMSVSEFLVKPVPQFGSQAQGHYDVICLWERPGAEVIAARLRELRLTMRNVVMLYLGRLTEMQQRGITRTCREHELAIAILDETLLLFLASERDARLPVFLHCALPLTALNPYTPFQAGDVPPEMFFGREDMVRELQRPAGSCLVYGGRQLGKSALLRHVERQFHRPEQNEFAWVEDMKLIFDPDAGKDSIHIWRILREGFKRAGLILSNVTTDNPDNIARYIYEAMQQHPHRRVIVMFDEADDFLDYDASDRFRVVLRLRELMSDTQRRFKVIFAGLHNVQRFQGIPNQPLAHFGAPLCVGPLEPKAAQELVQEPLKILGYRFADDANVLRILSYTNYHPGLIQIFCQALLNRLHRRTGRSLPPYLIEQNDVEDVYRLPEVRERIRERFDWTLALDLRYQAIAWAMISDQMEMEKDNSYASVYPPSEILELVRDWWPQGFEGMTSDQLRSLLGELYGLGVLVRNINGHYRLRSPNLVRLMGTEADIQNRLLELSDKELPGPFDADNHHAPLDDEARYYSPLSYAQDRGLTPQQFGVGLVCASEAAGLPMLQRAFKRYVSTELNTEIPKDVIDSEKLNDWLDKYLQTHKGHERLVVCYRPPDKARDSLESLVKVALDFCRRRRSRTGQKWLRVLFLFDPPTTWAWLSMPQERRENLENRADAVVWPHRWNLSGVRQRLAQHNKLDSEEICRFVLNETGGWPLLLDTLFKRCGAKDDPRSFAKAIGEELVRSDSVLGEQFRASLGLDVNEDVRRVWEFIHREDQVPVEWITPEMVGSEPASSSEAYNIAIEYLQRMGCILMHRDMDSAEAMVSAEATVKRVMLSP